MLKFPDYRRDLGFFSYISPEGSDPSSVPRSLFPETLGRHIQEPKGLRPEPMVQLDPS